MRNKVDNTALDDIYTPAVDAETGPFEVYEWHNGATTSTVSISETDTIYVTVINDHGCKASSDTLYAVQGEVPDFPVINEIGGGLVTVPAYSYIWFLDGDTLDGSNSQYWDPDTSGTYTVEVFSEDGCSLVSSPLYIDYSHIVELSKNEFIIFPNPFNDSFHVIKSNLENVHMILSDVTGKIVYEYTEFDNEELFITVSLPDLPAGVYILGLHYDDNFKAFRLVKE